MGPIVASPAAISDTMALLKVIADPKAAKAALDRIAQAEAAVEAHSAVLYRREEVIKSEHVSLDEHRAELARRHGAVTEAETQLAQSKKTHEDERAAHLASHAKEALAIRDRTAVQDARDRGLSDHASKLTMRADDLAKREAEVEARHKAAEEREKNVAVKETELSAKHARLAAALQI